MTTSLLLSKKLAEAGLKIETEKWWTEEITYSRREHKEISRKWYLVSHPRNCDGVEWISAPSTDELLEVMPATISNNEYVSHLRISKNEHLDTIYVEYPIIFNRKDTPFGYEDKNPAEALGQMCLYLLKNGYRYNPETKMIEK